LAISYVYTSQLRYVCFFLVHTNNTHVNKTNIVTRPSKDGNLHIYEVSYGYYITKQSIHRTDVSSMCFYFNVWISNNNIVKRITSQKPFHWYIKLFYQTKRNKNNLYLLVYQKQSLYSINMLLQNHHSTIKKNRVTPSLYYTLYIFSFFNINNLKFTLYI
jgi:hypothetical protein